MIENMMVLNVVLAGVLIAYADRWPDKAFTLHQVTSAPKAKRRICGRQEHVVEGRLFFFVAQRNNQHINVNGVDQLTCGRHQFAPEVLVVTTNHQIHIVFLDCIDQYLAQIAAALRVSVIG